MANDSIQIEYNQDLRALEKLLSGVKRAGDFFVSGSREMPMPKLEVDGAGILSFPVPAAQITSLIQQATRAPYGRGEETILDETVRKTWQIPAEKVRLGGKSWAANFDAVMKQVIAGLGCQGMVVAAELYKLLVYEKGGFFLGHRDTEKTKGMFGTLVIVLPSEHEGGELRIAHGEREVAVDLSGSDVSEVNFAAFYADCEHEVRPITRGSRVCLVFNLLQQRGARASAVQAPDYEPAIAQAAELLSDHLSSRESPMKIAWLLEHHYSPESLSFVALKLSDAARAKVLAQAAERAGCAAHLGIVHIEESGSAQEEYYDYGYRGRGWGSYHDHDEEEEATNSDFEVVEVCDSHHYVSEWRDLRDQPVDFGEIPLAPGELLPSGALDGEKPDDQRCMEASGNEGATFERSYHRAALMIWRHERYADVLLQAGVDAAIPYLEQHIEACAEKGSSSQAHAEAVALAQKLVRAWPRTPEFSGFFAPPRPAKRDPMLRLLTKLGDNGLLTQFIEKAVTEHFDGDENSALVAAARLLGAEKTGLVFLEIFRRHMRLQHGHCLGLLHALAAPTRGKAEWQSALGQLANAAVKGLDEVGRKQEDEWIDWEIREKAPSINAALVTRLLNVINKLDSRELASEAAEKLAARPTVFDPVTVIVPALTAVRQWDTAALALWHHSVKFLLERSAEPPEPPRDWRQEVTIGCSCADCQELRAFAIHPAEQVHRFRVRKDRRQHLHQQIERHELDMTHVTDRRGSPQTLVCTKDRRSYKRRCDQYHNDIAALASLHEMGEKLSRTDTLMLKRISEIRALATQWSPD